VFEFGVGGFAVGWGGVGGVGKNLAQVCHFYLLFHLSHYYL